MRLGYCYLKLQLMISNTIFADVQLTGRAIIMRAKPMDMRYGNVDM
jgi:hypothetical protein